jgi:5-methylcytosine-specific restriction endonuclease McrA
MCGVVVDGLRAHVDHIIPIEDGGTDDDKNLQVLCSADHGRKTVEEQRRRGYL